MNNELDTLLKFLRFPSVSTDPSRKDDVRNCGQWLCDLLQEGGMQAQLVETSTEGHPAVIAKGPQKENRPTVLIYGHYDVQPEDPLDLWESPPFEPTVKNDVIYARGATDNKGQLMAHALGALSLLEKEGDLPVNLTFLFEGEEEIGSPNLEPLLKSHREELDCDIIAVSDTGMVAPGVGTFTYGLRGIACLEFSITGPSGDLHSGIWGGSVANPASALASLIASLHDENGKVAIDGFYEGVSELEDWERAAWKKLPSDEAESLAITGASELVGESEYSDLERRWARPTAEVNGMGSGYQGEGSKTIIPSTATAKLSFRLVPGQDPQKILELSEAHLKKHLPAGVSMQITPGHCGSAYLTDPQNPAGMAAQRALQKTFPQSKNIALIREGGSIPIIQSFKDVLGVDTLLLGLALPDCEIHAPNENFPVANFQAGIELHRNLLEELSSLT